MNKLYFLGVVLLVVLGVAIKLAHDGKVIDAADKRNVTLQISNANLQHDATLNQQSSVVTDVVVAAVASDTQAVAPKQAVIERSTQSAVATVHAHYASLPKPTTHVAAVAQAQAESAAVSQVELKSAWQSYCAVVPTNSKCAQGAQP